MRKAMVSGEHVLIWNFFFNVVRMYKVIVYIIVPVSGYVNRVNNTRYFFLSNILFQLFSSSVIL